ncbi:MAG: response regulator [Burkholderiaceae bacterium]
MTTLRTFIVEDNPVILKNLVDTLEELTDLKVIGTTGNEEEAVKALSSQAESLDLVIVDVFLHSGSGLGVLKSAQQMSLPARRVVLTNYATEDIRRRCTSLGADAVFDKSSELEDLIDYCEKMTAE